MHVTLLYTAPSHICLVNESFGALIFMLKSEQELRKHCVLGFAVGGFFFVVRVFFTVTLAIYLMRWQKELKMTDCFGCSGAV